MTGFPQTLTALRSHAAPGPVTRLPDISDGITPQAIAAMRAHPGFAASFARVGANARGRGQTDRHLRATVKDRGGIVLGFMALCLHDSDEGLTVSRLRTLCVMGNICSPGRVDNHFALLKRWGWLEPVPGPSRGGARRHAPTPAYEDWFRGYLGGAIEALALVAPAEAARGLAELGGPGLYRFSVRMLAQASRHPPLKAGGDDDTLFMFAERDVGLAILYDLILRQEAGGGVARVSVAGFARDYSVSRAHVLKLLRDAHRAGALAWDAEARTVRVTDATVDLLKDSVAVYNLDLLAAIRRL